MLGIAIISLLHNVGARANTCFAFATGAAALVHVDVAGALGECLPPDIGDP
jgi:hypothetical protein